MLFLSVTLKTNLYIVIPDKNTVMHVKILRASPVVPKILNKIIGIYVVNGP